ncbi:MAG: TlyA family RNA methyltransferase [Candidatus Thorarchaeota archaeon]
MKERIDILLVERRLVESRTKAQWLIRNGFVIVNGIKITKPGKKVDNSYEIQLTRKFPYVGRGGLKLEAALNKFSISVDDKICVDIGASVGGFTDCMMQHGAKKVYAIDIAKDRLHPSLICEKMHDKVIPLLGVDARQIIPIDERIDVCTIDVTFSSLKEILPNVRNFLKVDADVITLVKPFFERSIESIDFDSDLKNSSFYYNILVDLIEWCIQNQFYPKGLIKSPLLDFESSTEFLLHLCVNDKRRSFKVEDLVNQALY